VDKPKPRTPVRERESGSAPPPPGGAPSRPPQQAAGHAAPPPASQDPPAGLDAARHAAAQRASHQAEVLREGAFPALMATALNLDKYFDTGAYRVYLANVMRDLGDPKDPIERMLVEQLCLAHFRVAQLHAGAGQAVGLEATKLLNTVAVRMLGEMRRTALSLKAYRTSAVPTKRQKDQLKVFKAAQ
jgi:hypothetical protein